LDESAVLAVFRISISSDEYLRFGREQRANAMFGDGVFSNVATFLQLRFLHDIGSIDKKGKVVGEGSKTLPFIYHLQPFCKLDAITPNMSEEVLAEEFEVCFIVAVNV
jgi:hypothetical protein